MTIVSPVVFALAVAFIVVAVVAAAFAVGLATNVVVTNRRARLARHESIRSYYGGGVALNH